jgi:SAM-dependent methyltransferase
MHALHLDGHGRLLDVGCGPGSLTLPLADRFEQAIGLDADRGMIEQAERLAGQSGARNMRWVQMRAEDLPGGLGSFRLVTFAQSFHWLDRPRVARTVRAMLDDNGACARIHATTHQGVENDVELPHPRPPHAAIAELVRRYLGPVRRAGQGRLPDGTASGEDEIYRAAGFTGPQRIEIRGAVATRVTDDIIAAVFSLSSSAPHLFGDHLTEFETANRRTRSPSTSGSRERHVRARHRPVRNGGSASRAGCRRARALSRARFRPAVSLAACT